MRSSRALLPVVVLSMMTACGGGGGGASYPTTPPINKPVTLVSLAVTPLSASVSVGTSEQFTAVGVLSDTSQQSLTGVAWTSSNASVATIDVATGKALSLATGTTLVTAVSGSFSASTVLKVTSGGVLPPANNVLPVTVNGSLCTPATSSNYPNKACVSVTVCSHGTSTCQTIPDILLDTGSYGLRVFGSVLNVPLNQVAAPDGKLLAECVLYGDGSSDWGPVQLADVVLGGETAANVPIQVIDQLFATPPSACDGPLADKSPTQTPGAGFNGILGVGLFVHDCGPTCANSVGNGMYYSCSGSTSGLSSCSTSTAPLTSQVQNPVSLLPVDNNGVILSLPSVDAAGVASASGSLVLGIGTQSNNQPWAVATYGADGNADFITVFNGTTYTNAFIDSGSNGFYFPSAIQNCAGWYCPSSLQNLIATTRGASGTPSADVSFTIANVSASANSVFNDLGAYSAGVFDWGLPFFFGRDVYFGIGGTSSPVGTGPYWAY